MPDSEPQPQHHSMQVAQRRLRDRLLFAVAGIAGYIDALSFIALGQIFVANITGTTVLLGLALARQSPLFALRACASLAGFLLGVSIAALVIRPRMSNAIWPRSVTVALSVEIVLLVILSTLGLALGLGPERAPIYILIALAACAMGVQSVAVRTLGVADITTTYITGTWVALLAGLTRRLRAEVETTEERPTLASLYPQERDARLLLVYMLAAALCGLLANVSARLALIPLAPALALVVVIAARGFRMPDTQAESSQRNQ